jgi:exo-beta-1,3-glucanase (GH17 family)
MESPRNLFSWFFFVLVSTLYAVRVSSASLGINYGQLGNNLPVPSEVIPLIHSIGAKRVKLFDANPLILRAFANTDIELMVGLGNELLSEMRDPQNALTWVKANVQVYLPATKITGIMVGNEVLTLYNVDLSNNLAPAMQSIYGALLSLGLHKNISVVTAHSFNIMGFSYPPSAGAFEQDLREYMTEILNFHEQTGSPFYINVYPYFAYKGSPKKIPLDYVLFEPNSGFVDPTTHLFYDNMLFAQIDAVYSAISLLGYKGIHVCVSETGWPSKGDIDEVGATLDNAAKYNGNLINMVAENKVTPLRPSSDLDIYIFALFNENMKPGPTSERNFGLFQPDRTPVYPLQLAPVQLTRGVLVPSSSAIRRYNQVVVMLILLCSASISLLLKIVVFIFQFERMNRD